MELVNAVLEYLSGQSVWWGLLIVMLSAMIEYIVPPFPGDSVTLVASVLIPTADWPVVGVFGAVMLGSMFGSALNWWVGHWVASDPERDTFVHRWLRRPNVAKRLDRIKSQFQQRGTWYIAANRFVPAFRSLFFLAAGVAGLRLGPVLLWAAVSAALWNGAILAVGSAVGYNLEVLVSLLDQYTNLFWGLVVVALVVWVIRRFWPGSGDEEPPPERDDQNLEK